MVTILLQSIQWKPLTGLYLNFWYFNVIKYSHIKKSIFLAVLVLSPMCRSLNEAIHVYYNQKAGLFTLAGIIYSICSQFQLSLCHIGYLVFAFAPLATKIPRQSWQKLMNLENSGVEKLNLFLLALVLLLGMVISGGFPSKHSGMEEVTFTLFIFSDQCIK